MRLYVGNLPYSLKSGSEVSLCQHFTQVGQVREVKLMFDRDTGRCLGYGFIEMESGGQKAIDILHQVEFQGRKLIVNEARPLERKHAAEAFRGDRQGNQRGMF